jgi:hypothetical protein
MCPFAMQNGPKTTVGFNITLFGVHDETAETANRDERQPCPARTSVIRLGVLGDGRDEVVVLGRQL